MIPAYNILNFQLKSITQTQLFSDPPPSLREINGISFNKHFVCANEYLNERETAHSTPSRSKRTAAPTQ